MEIKSINTSHKISKVHTAAKNELGFDKGEIIYAEIVSIDGETVTLKTGEGVQFTAKILSELKLAVGDGLKLAVKGRQGGKLVMQALSVNPDLIEISYTETQQSDESKLILLIANLLKKYGIQPTAERVNEIIAGMEKNPGLDVKAAVFMAANGIDYTQENVQIIKQLESGDALISNNLLELAGQLVLNEAFPENEDAQTILKLISESLPYSRQPENGGGAKALNISVDPERNFYTVTAAKMPVKAFAGGAEPAPGETNAQEGTVAFAAETARAETVKNIISRLFEGGGKIDFESVRSLLPDGGEAAAAGQSAFQDKAVQEILAKTLAVFSRIKDAEAGGKDLKTESGHKLEKLFELKEALKNSDIKNRDVLADRLDKTISQSKLISEINRYTLLHIPVNMGRDRKTAEIYVYRRKKKGGKSDAEEISILIGLDTENLGRFEVLIRAKDKNLSVKMARGGDRANEVIALRAEKLKKAFAELGYNLSDFKIERLHEKTTPANAEEILMGDVSQSSFKIDYTV